MSSDTKEAYDRLVGVSVERYRAHLDDLMSDGGHALFLEAIARIRELLDDSPKWGLRPHYIERLTCPEKLSLLNPFSLGLGSPTAPVIAVGTEHAYDLCSLENLVLEGYSLTALWQHDVGADVAGTLAERQDWRRSPLRPFHLHPTDYYPISSGHTWSKLARLLSLTGVPALTATTTRNLCDCAHQIELSHVPAKRVIDGSPTSKRRRDFLAEAFKTFATCGAKVVLIHGSSADESARDVVVTSFLEQSNELSALPSISIGTRQIARWKYNERLAIHIDALSYTSTNEYHRAVAREIASAFG